MFTWDVTGKVKRIEGKEYEPFAFRVRGEDKDAAFIHADDVLKHHYGSGFDIEKESLQIKQRPAVVPSGD